MIFKLNKLVGVLAIFTIISGFNSQAKAQPTASTQFQRPQTTADRFEQIFYSNDKPYFENRSVLRQLDTIFGFGSLDTGFLEREIETDTQAVHKFYVDALANQVASDPTVRTRDLPNPYNSSILQPARNEALIQMLQNQ